MPRIRTVAESPCAETRPTMPLVAPEKLSTWEKVVAPMMMKRMVPETATVPVSAFISDAQVRLRYAIAARMVPAAPSAAASVGVAQPAVMAPTTMPKMRTSGSTWTRNGTQRATPGGACSTGPSGASDGSSVARRMM